MCLACGEATVAGTHSISITERPEHRLCGLTWEGTYGDAAAGAIHTVIERVKAWSDSRAATWKSPVVGISWNDRPDGFRYFVGVATEQSEAAPEDFSTLDLPEMRFASSWHGEADGEVVAHYGSMIDWLRDQGLVWDKSRLHHREEYPVDVNLKRPPSLRLLLPVADADVAAK